MDEWGLFSNIIKWIGYVIEFLIAKEVLLQFFGFRNDSIDDMPQKAQKELGLRKQYAKKEQLLSEDVSKASHSFSGTVRDQFSREKEMLEKAKFAASFISKNYKPLSKEGTIEAVIFYCTQLDELCCMLGDMVLESPKYSSDLNFDKSEDRLVKVLVDYCGDKLGNDKYGFLNNRFEFYSEEFGRLKEDSYYSPLFIYNAFYNCPLSQKAKNVDIHPSPIDLLQFHRALIKSESLIQ